MATMHTVLRAILEVTRRPWWIAAAVAPLVFIVVVNHLVHSDTTAQRALRIKYVSVAKATPGRSEPPALGEWSEVPLPHQPMGQNQRTYAVWYRIDVDVHEPSNALWAIYLPAPFGNYSVMIDGRLVASTDRMESPLPIHSIPTLLSFPGDLLHEGRNSILLYVAGNLWWPGLNAVYVGPEQELEPMRAAANFWASVVKQSMIAGMLIMSMTLGVLYCSDRRNRYLGWYALGLVLWALQVALQLIVRPPFELPFAWAHAPNVAYGSACIAAAFFVHRFVGVDATRIERWFKVWPVIGAASLALDLGGLGIALTWFIVVIWLPPILFLGVRSTWYLVRAALEPQHFEARLFATIFWWALVIGVADGFVVFGFATDRPLYLTYVAGPILFAFGVFLLRRFVRAAESIERSRDELATRVREQSEELERNLVRMKDIERERALSEERDRIMRDVHDGVGGQLVQALSIATARPELRRLEEPLRACLDELRLIIDSIEPSNGDLGSVLGALRARVARRLSEANVALRWQVGDVSGLEKLGPERVLHMTRIVHEAIVSALKHANTKQLTLKAFGVPAHDSYSVMVVELIIDAAAFELPEAILRAMERNALALGARLSCHVSSATHIVRLELPSASMANRLTEKSQSPTQVLPIDVRGLQSAERMAQPSI